MGTTWPDPRDWVGGETVTAAIMNTYVRDSLDYLYGTTGNNINLAGCLYPGYSVQLQVQRTPYARESHSEWGLITSGMGSSGLTVSFTRAFNATPAVVATAYGGIASIMRISVASTTGFTVVPVSSGAACIWIAMGYDTAT